MKKESRVQMSVFIPEMIQEIRPARKQKTSKNKKPEEALQIAISYHIKMNYPDVIFTSESSGMNVTSWQAISMRNKRSENKLPDLWIPEARGGFFGLFIELKAEGIDIQKTLSSTSASNKHVKEQHDVLITLRGKGYKAEFGVGFSHTKNMVDAYMAHEITESTYR